MRFIFTKLRKCLSKVGDKDRKILLSVAQKTGVGSGSRRAGFWRIENRMHQGTGNPCRVTATLPGRTHEYIRRSRGIQIN
jgi:hypothetical protein